MYKSPFRRHKEVNLVSFCKVKFEGEIQERSASNKKMFWRLGKEEYRRLGKMEYRS